MMFISEYAITFQVLSSPVQHSADVAVIIHVQCQLCDGIHDTWLSPLSVSQSVRWRPFSRKLSVPCYTKFKSIENVQHIFQECTEQKHLLTDQ
jgi:hypothetical protein